jgi:Fatty acid desaturase
MLDYSKYLLSPALLAVEIYGMSRGGAWTWLGLGVLMSIMAFDMTRKPDFSLRDTRHAWLYDVAVTITMLAGFAQVLAFAYFTGSGHFDRLGGFWGAFAGTLVFGFVVAAPPVHELFHRDQRFLRFLGRVGTALIFDPWREITHVVTHHLKVCTPDDPDTARRGDTVYRHLSRTFVLQGRDAFELERMMWTKHRRAWWSPRNQWVRRAAGLALFAGVLYAIGGWRGTGWTLAAILLGPRMLLEIFNYVNHYGLVTETPGQFQRRHTWNHLTPFVRILALEITNHAGHHEDSYKPFYELVPDRTGPLQPQFLLCVLASFVPPIWFRFIIRPLLQDWDERFATPRERELAHQENLRAGWVDVGSAQLELA